MAYKDKHDPRLLEKRREHYRKNKDAYIQRTRDAEEKMKNYVLGLKNAPCSNCGVEYPDEPWLMEWDHRDMSAKSGSIGKFVKGGSWKKLQEELDKCDLLCVVCHRRKTAIDLQWGATKIDLTLLVD